MRSPANARRSTSRSAAFFAGVEPLERAGGGCGAGPARDGNSTRIAILAGAGVEHDAAAARLKDVAERWSIPVATTLRAKGVFPEDHDCRSACSAMPARAMPPPRILAGDLDFLLVLGSGLNERDTMHWTLRERIEGAS